MDGKGQADRGSRLAQLKSRYMKRGAGTGGAAQDQHPRAWRKGQSKLLLREQVAVDNRCL